jgi:imidazoleglycerol phosphate dehydratase HisB
MKYVFNNIANFLDKLCYNALCTRQDFVDYGTDQHDDLEALIRKAEARIEERSEKKLSL